MTKIKHIALTTQDPDKAATLQRGFWAERDPAQPERCGVPHGWVHQPGYLELED